jgi:hypothetical protein
MVQRENSPAVVVGPRRVNVHLLNNSATSWQTSKLSIVLNAQVSHVTI